MTQADAIMPLTSQAQTFIDSVLRQRPRIAVFDCDGTLWRGDSGEQFMYWEIQRRLIPETVARWIGDRYRQYKAGGVSEEAICGEMVTINDGVELAMLEREADEFFAAEFAGAIFPDMRELVAQLHQSGCQVWAVSSTNDWVVRAGGRYFDIPAECVIAASVHSDNGTATGRLQRVPTDEDKAVAIRELIQGPVDAVFGNSMHDAAMLALASNAYAVNPNPDLQQLAQQQGWNVYFPMGVMPR
jgi:HAD superfamily phosphoserine phosphatase-like hydrolase